MRLDEPEKVMFAFVTYLEARELEPLVSLYEPDCLFVPEPGVQIRGHQELREAFRGMFASEPSLALHRTEVVRTSELALAANDWTLQMVLPDGSKLSRSGRSSLVLRRQNDGTYRIVIDRP